MSRDLQTVHLREVLTRRKEEIQVQDLETYKRLTIHLNGKGITVRDSVAGSEIGTKKQFIARARQLVLSKIDARNGAFGVLPDKCDGAIITGNFWAFDVNLRRLDPQYFEYLTKTPLFIDFCVRASEGTTNRRYLQEPKFLAQEIPLPPLDEQRRIVARIEALAAKIEEARRLRLRSLQNAARLVASLHLSLARERTLKIEDFLDLHEIREPVEFGHSYPQVGVKGFGQGLFPTTPVEAGQTTYKTFNRLYDGAVVLSQVKGWEGAIAVCGSELSGRYVSPEYRTFRCIPEMAIPDYLSELFSTPWFWTKLSDLTRGVGARRERIRPEFFLNMEIPMPRVDDQRRAVRMFEKVRSVKRIQAETATELDALLPSILDKAFKGEL